ncbi:MAG: hypothetical protein JRJ85_15230 [Deltaproteobacteria bacterium]|nr:hypothetical protein [Deltaproteobacteria bacterium]
MNECPAKREPCPDCDQCQVCSPTRCRSCRKGRHPHCANDLGTGFTYGQYLAWKSKKETLDYNHIESKT